MGIEKKVVSIRMDDKLICELKLMAKAENRPLSNLIETILKQYMSSKENSQKDTEK